MSDLLNALLPLYYATKVFGLSSYKIVSGHFEPSAYGAITICIMVILYFLVGFYAISFYPLKVSNVIVNMVIYTRIYTSFVTIIIIYVNEIIVQSEYKTILMQLEAIDSSLKELGVKIYYTQTKRIILSLVVLLYFFVITVTILDYWAYWETDITVYRLLFTLLYVIPNAVLSAASYSICIYVSLVKQRFSIVNDKVLMSVLDALKLNYCSDYALDPKIDLCKMQGKIIMKTKRVHYDLCMVMEKLHSIYSWPLLFIMGVCYSTVFTQLYFWFSGILHQSIQDFKVLSMIHSTSVLIMMSSNVIGLTSVCDRCFKEAKRTALLLFRIMAKADDEDIVNSAKLFTVQLLDLPKPMTAAGFFHVNKKLLSTIVGSTITFLVILIQFDLTAVAPI